MFFVGSLVVVHVLDAIYFRRRESSNVYIFFRSCVECFQQLTEQTTPIRAPSATRDVRRLCQRLISQVIECSAQYRLLLEACPQGGSTVTPFVNLSPMASMQYGDETHSHITTVIEVRIVTYYGEL